MPLLKGTDSQRPARRLLPRDWPNLYPAILRRRADCPTALSFRDLAL
jgi:hypothetical protein